MSYKRVDRLYWRIIIFLAIATVAMSIVGLYTDSHFARQVASLPADVVLLEVLDKTLLLFLAEGRSTIDPDNYLLRVARILSVIVILGAIVKLALELLVQRWERHKISRLRNHMIICGLGEGGHAFAHNMSDGTDILIIDPTFSPADEFQAEQNGWYYINADSREASTLLSAGLYKAKGMVITCGDDTVNLEILELSQQLFDKVNHTNPFTFLLELTSAQLSESISDQFVSNKLHENIELFTFSRPDLTTREFVWNIQLAEYARFRNQDHIHLIFIGYDEYAEAVIDKLVSASIISGFSAMNITIFSPDPEVDLEAVIDKYYLATDYIHIEGFETSEVRTILKTKDFDTVTALFIFEPDDKSCVNRAITTRDFLIQNNQDHAPIFMRLDRDFALTDLLVSTEQTYRMGEVLQAFGMNNSVCHPDLINGELEQIARKLHDQYLVFSTEALDEEQKQAKISSHVPWRLLSETKKNANRRSVDHIPSKLTSLGIKHKPGYDLDIPKSVGFFSDDNDSLERLAELEQKSWSAGKYAEGWIPGKVRDDRRKIHDSLQYRYHELTEVLKGYDRDQIQILDHNVLRRSKNKNTSNKPEVMIAITANLAVTSEEAQTIKEFLLETLAPELTEHGADCTYTLISNLNPNADTFVLDILTGWLAKKRFDFRTIIHSMDNQNTMFCKFKQAIDDHVVLFNEDDDKKDKARSPKTLDAFLKTAHVEWILHQDLDISKTMANSVSYHVEPGFKTALNITKDKQVALNHAEPKLTYETETANRVRNYAVQISQ